MSNPSFSATRYLHKCLTSATEVLAAVICAAAASGRQAGMLSQLTNSWKDLKERSSPVSNGSCGRRPLNSYPCHSLRFFASMQAVQAVTLTLVVGCEAWWQLSLVICCRCWTCDMIWSSFIPLRFWILDVSSTCGLPTHAAGSTLAIVRNFWIWNDDWMDLEGPYSQKQPQ